jgi:hypothetical protein
MISCDEFIPSAIPKLASNAILDSVDGLELWSSMIYSLQYWF